MKVIINHHLQVLSVDNENKIKLLNINEYGNYILFDNNNFFVSGRECFFCCRSGEVIVSTRQDYFPITTGFCGEEQIYFSLNGGFLSSNTSSIFIQPFCGDWEKFYLLDEKKLQIIRNCFAKGCYIQGSNVYLPPEEIIQNKNGIKFGKYNIKIENIIKSIKTESNRIIFFRDNLGIIIIKPFNPLVYLTCFGGSDIISSAEESIYSLFHFGDFIGEVLIITDNENISFSEKLLPFMGRIHFQKSNAYDFFDFTLSRYMISNISEMINYSPIMYMDCDIIINSNINEVFHDSMKIDKILFSEEYRLSESSPWFGGEHWKEVGKDYKLMQSGINSGIFVFNSIDAAKEILISVVQSMINSQKTKHSRSKIILETLDQPNLNYVLMAHFPSCFDTEKLTSYVFHGSGGCFSDIPTLGFAHFNGGLGNFESRLELMRNYVKYIENKN
ncbi:glycosyltransferase [Gluconobacter sp. OJA]|uniref:glycosyltransferase n=1 Tax=Gluconobacter sp. OJA TaxID=3145197 RepID=UPI0031F95735